MLTTTAFCGSGSSEDDITDAARTAAQVPVAADLELRLLYFLFDSSDEGPGLQAGSPPERRAADLVQNLSSSLGECVEANVAGAGVTLRFSDCSGPYEEGILTGDLEVAFEDGDVVRLSSESLQWGTWSLQLQLMGRLGGDTSQLLYTSDSRLSNGEATVDFGRGPTLDEPCVDALECAVRMDRPGCLQSLVRIPNVGAGNFDYGLVAGSFQRCANRCPGDCDGGECNLSMSLVGDRITMRFNGSEVVSVTDEAGRHALTVPCGP